MTTVMPVQRRVSRRCTFLYNRKSLRLSEFAGGKSRKRAKLVFLWCRKSLRLSEFAGGKSRKRAKLVFLYMYVCSFPVYVRYVSVVSLENHQMSMVRAEKSALHFKHGFF